VRFTGGGERGELVAKRNRRGLGNRKNNEREISRIVNSQRASKCHASPNSNISSEKIGLNRKLCVKLQSNFISKLVFCFFFRLDPKLMYVSLSRRICRI
jgi:hypothetical protein